MTEYWKSQEKKYCDICKCWLTDNPTSIQIHENGVRHKMNSQEKLRDIQKKAKSKDKEDKQLAKMLRGIEEKAAAAAALDKESNPDMSLKIQSYMDYIREKEASIGGNAANPVPTDPKAKILHREESSANDIPDIPVPRPYTSRFGGWTPVTSTGPKLDLELPSSGYSVSAGKIKKKKASSSNTSSIMSAAATITAPPSINYTAKIKEKPKHVFQEKVAPVATSVATSSVKSEPGGSEIAFKKRKLNRPNARQPIDD